MHLHAFLNDSLVYLKQNNSNNNNFHKVAKKFSFWFSGLTKIIDLPSPTKIRSKQIRVFDNLAFETIGN